jgi:hypothetical protein
MVFLSFTLYPTSTYSLTTKPVPSTYDFVLVTLPVNQGKLTLFRYFPHLIHKIINYTKFICNQKSTITNSKERGNQSWQN